MAAGSGYECQYFYEDEVYCFKEKTQTVHYGIVVENSEYASSDEDDDSENEAPKLKRGQIRVAWYPTGKENVTSEKKVFLEDRSLMPGDVVARKENGREKVCGYCRNVKTVAAVRILDSNLVIENVKSEDLQPLEEFSPDIAVTLSGWVGMARSVKSKIIMRTRDGSLCSMDDHEALELRNVHNKFSKNSEFHHDEFYPGQILSGKLSKFANATWLEGSLHIPPGESASSSSKIQMVAKVEKVELLSLGVQWQCQSWSGNPSLNEQPKFLIEGDDLKKVRMLNVFEPCTLQLGDKSFYHLKSSDKTLNVEDWYHLQKKRLFPIVGKEKRKDVSTKAPTSDEWESEASDEDQSSSRNTSQGGGRTKGTVSNFSVSVRSRNRRKLKKAKTKTTNADSMLKTIAAGDRLVVETLCTNSWVDVVWQDGTSECGVSSKDLFPVYHLDDKEFFPGDFVVQADSKCNMAILDYGVIQRVNAQARTAVVQWMKTDTKPEWINPVVTETAEVSVYDLKDHPDFKFRPGSIVVRVADTGESSVGAAGQVLDNHQTGKVEVWWSEGQTTLCWPQELYRIGDYDSEAGELWDDETEFDDVEDFDQCNVLDDSQQSWETESETSVAGDVSYREIDTPPSKSRSCKVNRLAVNFEKASNALQKLCTLLDSHDQISDQLSSLQTGEVLKVLLDVYKQCRYLDRLMGSSFFHERNFEGLLEKVCQEERPESNHRLSDHLCCLLGFSKAKNAEPCQSRCDTVPICQKAAADDADTSSEETLNHVMDVVKEICQGDMQQKEEGASNEGKTASDSGPLKIRQVCIRLSQLLRSQLSFSTEEMNRWCSNKFKEPSEEEPGEEEPVVDQDSARENSEAAVTSSQLEPSESDVNVEETVIPLEGRGIFTILENAPSYHKYYWSSSQPSDPKLFQKYLRKELNLLSTSLPSGIHVKTFEDRMDLFSVLIEGPAKTPYEGGLFIFDFQLPNDYPHNPPTCHYWSYCSERLNPNLYEEGKVCISLLGTWSGKGSEVWGPGSNLLQVLVSIQGLILVPEPYYNEAGYEKQRGSQQARENSRLYNEMVLLKMLQAMTNLAKKPQDLWSREITEFLRRESSLLINRYQTWTMLSENTSTESVSTSDAPVFPLLPASRGFCLTLNKSLHVFERIVGVTLKKRGSSLDSPDHTLNVSHESNLSR